MYMNVENILETLFQTQCASALLQNNFIVKNAHSFEKKVEPCVTSDRDVIF